MECCVATSDPYERHRQAAANQAAVRKHPTTRLTRIGFCLVAGLRAVGLQVHNVVSCEKHYCFY